MKYILIDIQPGEFQVMKLVETSIGEKEKNYVGRKWSMKILSANAVDGNIVFKKEALKSKCDKT